MTLMLYPWPLAIDPVASLMEASTVRPGLLPSRLKGVGHEQFAFWNMIMWVPSPLISLTLGLAHVSLPVIFVWAPAMATIPQSSAGTRMIFRIGNSGEGGKSMLSSGESVKSRFMVDFTDVGQPSNQRTSGRIGGA